MPRPAIIGESGAMMLGAMLPMLEDGSSVVGRARRAPQRLTRAARRLRNPASGAPAGEPYSLIDRADVLAHIVERADLPEMAALVALARTVLGHELRDARTISTALGPNERLARQGLVVALGLLGAVPPLAEACPDRSDPEALQAYLAAVGLGVEDLTERRERGREADLSAVRPEQRVTGTARRRLDAGERFRAVD